MKLTTLFILIPMSLFSISAIANVDQVYGDTNCTVVHSIDKKKATEIPCTYDGSVGGSMSYAISQLNFKLSTGDRYRTVNDATFTFDKNGSMKNLKETISVNGKPAKVVNLHHRTFKEISDKEIEKRYEREIFDFSDVLHCYKYSKRNSAFCVPYEFISSIS